MSAAPTDRVLDVATGTGLVARELVRRYGCSVVGLDQSPEMLAGARRAFAGRPGLADGSSWSRARPSGCRSRDGEFDHLTFTYLLRYVDDPAATLAELARVVRPGGRIASLEFGLPDPPVWRPLWRLYVRAVLPAAGRLFGADWHEVGRFLGPSIEALYSDLPLPRQARALGARGDLGGSPAPDEPRGRGGHWGVRGG